MQISVQKRARLIRKYYIGFSICVQDRIRSRCIDGKEPGVRRVWHLHAQEADVALQGVRGLGLVHVREAEFAVQGVRLVVLVHAMEAEVVLQEVR
jgi:hypothetical protein